MCLEQLSNMEAKFNIRDNVRILANEIQPEYVGRVGRISKVYGSYSAKMGYCTVYRVNVGGKLLKGVACEDDLELSINP